MTTRQDAIAAGATHYLPERPCARSHTALRYVRSGACLQCLTEDRGPSLLVTLRCHPDDVATLRILQQHLAAARALTSP